MKHGLTDKERVEGFLEEYKALCDKWGVIVLSEGEQVEAVAGECGDYWGIEKTTHERKAYDNDVDVKTPESSNISAFGYDRQASALTVRFNSGEEYRYFEVPIEIYEGMRKAKSRGSFLNKYVKGVYRYHKKELK